MTDPSQPTILMVAHARHHEAEDDRAARHLRTLGYCLEFVCPAEGERMPAGPEGYSGTFLYGGAACVNELDAYPFLRDELAWVRDSMAAETPVLGVCLGGQIVAAALGAEVGPTGACEYGYFPLQPTEAGRTLIPEGLHVPQAHFHGFGLPEGAELLASSAAFPHQAFRHGPRTYGFQFHPEVTLPILERWVREPWQPVGAEGHHPAERQLADGRRLDGALDAWFTGFLESWIGPARKAAA